MSTLARITSTDDGSSCDFVLMKQLNRPRALDEVETTKRNTSDSPGPSILVLALPARTAPVTFLPSCTYFTAKLSAPLHPATSSLSAALPSFSNLRSKEAGLPALVFDLTVWKVESLL